MSIRLQCKQCGGLYSDTDHVCADYFCSFCGRRFKSKEDIDDHGCAVRVVGNAAVSTLPALKARITYCEHCLQPYNDKKHVCPSDRLICLLCNLHFNELSEFNSHISFTHGTIDKKLMNVRMNRDMDTRVSPATVLSSSYYQNGENAYRRLVMSEAPHKQPPSLPSKSPQVDVAICLRCFNIDSSVLDYVHRCNHVRTVCMFCSTVCYGKNELFNHLKNVHDMGNNTEESVSDALENYFGPREDDDIIRVRNDDFESKRASRATNLEQAAESPPHISGKFTAIAIFPDRRNVYEGLPYCNLCAQQYEDNHVCKTTEAMCFICELYFENAEDLNRHFLETHGSSSPREYVQNYTLGGMIKKELFFVWKRAVQMPVLQRYCGRCLQYHREPHSCINIDVRCLLCGNMYNNSPELREHLKDEHNLEGEITFDPMRYVKIVK